MLSDDEILRIKSQTMKLSLGGVRDEFISFARAIERAATAAAFERAARICDKAETYDQNANASLGWGASVTCPYQLANAIRAEAAKEMK